MKQKKKIPKILIFAIITIVVYAAYAFFTAEDKPISITYSEAISMIREESFEKIDINKITSTAKFYTKDLSETYETIIPSIELFTEELKEIENSKNIKIEYISESSEKNYFSTIYWIMIISFMGYVFWKIRKTMKKMEDSTEEMSKIDADSIVDKLLGNNSTIQEVETTEYSFKDVAGVDEELEEIQEVVSILKDPERYKKIGAKVPKGILLSGESGTGKTLIAKAIAGEAKVKFYPCSGSNFDNKFVGVGADTVRKLFENAKKNAPSIIFIDEIDSVAKARYESQTYHEQTLNQLLSEMDGFSSSDNVIVIAATNHLEVLDKAILRPGRFDKIINIPLPDKKGRRDIIEVHSRNKIFDEQRDSNLDELAKRTAGMSGANLEAILNDAAILAVRANKDKISKEELNEAFIKVVLGVSKKDKEITSKEKYLVAIHEAGHALVSRALRPDLEILEASIISRGNAGGYNLYADSEKRFPSKKDFFNDIAVSLGGRAAEMLVFSEISVGASGDLDKSTRLAHKMIYTYAMGSNNQLVKIYGEKDFNDKLENTMFPQVQNIVDDAYQKAFDIVKNHKTVLIRIADELTRKSTLDSSELEELFSHFNL